jgi:hypothetical protein
VLEQVGISTDKLKTKKLPDNVVTGEIAKQVESMEVVTKYKFTHADKNFFINPALSGDLTLAEYTAMLNAMAKIDRQKYMKYTGIDILRIDTKAYFSNKILDAQKQAKFQKDIKLKLPDKVRREQIKRISPKVMRKLGTFLNDRFSNTTVKTLNSADIATLYGEKYAKAKAFVYNGIVVINTNKATIQTVMHEMGHLYLAELKSTDYNLYKTILTKLDGDPELETMAQLYPELSKEDLLEELFVEKLANYNSGALSVLLETDLEQDGDPYGKVTAAFEGIFGDFLGTNLSGTIDINDSLLTIFAKIGKDIIFNKNSALKSFTKSDKTEIHQIIDPYSLSDRELIKFMQSKGLIEVKCA